MKILFLILFLSTITGLYSQTKISEDKAFFKADSLIKTLTLKEKSLMIRGFRSFFIKGFEEKGIMPIYLSDASQGIRINKTHSDLVDILDRSTAFPSPILLASTFSPELSYEYAKAIGEECRAGGIDILLGPGLNIQRQSQCGRNFEYFGEDPYLIGQIVAQYVKGLQSTGTAACLKHFLGNNSEFYRRRSNSIIDERTLNEIYLPGFKAGIEAGAMSVMTSYNLVNGEWAGQSSYVIKELLRKQLGFKWLVMSDWNSVWDLEKIIKSGQNLEMPGRYKFDTSVEELIEKGSIKESNIDEMIRPIFATAFAMGFYDRPKYDKSLLKKFPEHEKLAMKVAEEGIVMLKNKNNILPLGPSINRNILLTGKYVMSIPTGQGSANVVGYNNIKLIDALKKVYGRTIYYIEKPTKKDLEDADIVLLSMGTQDREAVERPFALSKEDEMFMKYITDNNPNTIAIISSGSPIDMSSWNDKLSGLFYCWYCGQNGFEALANIISGKISPSGKLPITIERSFNNSPAYGYLPPNSQFYKEDKNEQLIKVYDINYNEGVLVGYRWYDTKNISPLYHFGFGLSYSTFSLSKASISSKRLYGDESLSCSVTIENTGDFDASQVIQLYISEENPSVLRPVKELKRFKKVYLKSGEKKKVTFEIDSKDLSYWDIKSHSWIANSGKFKILIGTSSKDIDAVLSFEYKNKG